jgi:phosphate transport system permease protein
MENPDLRIGQAAEHAVAKVSGNASWNLKQLEEKLIEWLLIVFTVMSAGLIFFIMFFVIEHALPVFKANGPGFVLNTHWDQDFLNAFMARPGMPTWIFGALPLIVGTVYTTLGALVIAVPLGLGCAIFMTEICPSWLRQPLASTVRLLAAIPSVIYGLVGLIVVVPLIAHVFISKSLAMSMISIAALDGTSILAGAVVLSAMIGPIFVALSSDALRAVPRSYKEAAFALGISHWRTIIKVMVPAARKGILAGGILATGRAIGEAIALSMVSGAVATMPDFRHGLVFFLEPVRTLASAIVTNSEGMLVPSCQSALFACATLLLLSSVVLSLLARFVSGLVQKETTSHV